MNFLLRTYAWLTLLGRNGLINTIITKIGFQPLDLIYNDKAVLLGMVYNFLPFMVLPIYSVLVKIDKNLIEAAEDLGANKTTVFSKVIFPLSIPGIMTGITIVFIPAVSTFIISSLLGGNKYNLIGNLIEQQFRWTGDWHFGSSMSIILMIFILITMALTSKFDKDKEGGGEDYGKQRYKKTIYILIFLFLYAPIIVLIVFSFNNSKSRGVWAGFTLKWYIELFQDANILKALYYTILIAVLSAIISTIIGTFAAIGISNMPGISKKIVLNLNYLPVLNPDIVTAVSLMVLFRFLRLDFGFTTMLLSHITFYCALCHIVGPAKTKADE